MRRVIQRCPTSGNVVTQIWSRTPQQCHGASDMRSRHRRAAKAHISGIGRVIAGTSACARRTDIGLYPITPIDCHRPAAAKRGYVVGAGIQCADGVRCRVDSWRIHYSGTVGTVIARASHHHDPGGSLSFDSRLQCVSRTTFRRRADPRVTRNIGSSEWIALPAAYWIRRQEPFHALDVSGRRAITLIHITTADPLCAGGHPDLIAHAIVANRGPHRMRAMTVVITRERRIVSTGISGAVMDRVMPIVIVIGHDSVPATVVRLKRVVRPALAGISSGDGNSLTPKSEPPHIRSVRICNARFNGRRILRLRRGGGNRIRLRQQIFNGWIAFYSCYIGMRRQRFGYLAATFDQDRVDNVKGTMLNTALTQPSQDRCLCRLAFVP